MKGKMVVGTVLAMIITSFYVNRPAYATPVKSCRDAKISHIQLRNICEDYLALNCLNPL